MFYVTFYNNFPSNVRSTVILVDKVVSGKWMFRELKEIKSASQMDELLPHLMISVT